MAINYKYPGEHIEVTLGATHSSGDVIVVGELVGVALQAGVNGSKIQIALEGVWELPKGTGANTDFSVGAALYWNDSSNIIVETSNSGANKLIGYAAKAATTTDTTCEVLLARP